MVRSSEHAAKGVRTGRHRIAGFFPNRIRPSDGLGDLEVLHPRLDRGLLD